MTQNTLMQPDDRKPYECPKLTEFGTLAALTQGGGASVTEGTRPIPGKRN